MVVGAAPSSRRFTVGLPLEDYDSLFAENLDLLLEISEHEHVHWSASIAAP